MQDIQQYISQYEGFVKISRALSYANGDPSKRTEALGYAVQLASQLQAGAAFKEIEEHANNLMTEVSINQQTVEQCKQAHSNNVGKKEQEISHAKATNMKDSIRLCFMDLGMIYLEYGDHNLAIKTFIKGKEFCTTNEHHFQLCMNVIRAAFCMKNFGHIQSYASKASMYDTKNQKNRSRLSIIQAICAIENRNFKAAAKSIADHFQEAGDLKYMLTERDLCLYAGVCALATYDRADLQGLLNKMHIIFESFPEVRNAIQKFLYNKYTECLFQINNFWNSVQVDLVLQNHAVKLLEMIRQRTMVQFLYPYKSISLTFIAQCFNESLESIEKEIASLIADNLIQAKLDSHNKVLHATKEDVRVTMFRKSLKLGQDFVNETQDLLLRSSLIKNKKFISLVSTKKLDPRLAQFMGFR